MKRNIRFRYGEIEYRLTVEQKENELLIDNKGKQYRVTLIDEPEEGKTVPHHPYSAVLEKSATELQPIRQNGGLTEKAAITGVIKQIAVTVGSKVKNGDLLLIMEAMKMDIDVVANATGRVENILVHTGMNVTAGQELITIG